MTSRAIIFVFCALWSSDLIARELTWHEVVENYSEQITSVQICGRWRSDNASGFIRVASTEFLLGGSRLWIQWMAERGPDGETSIVASLDLPMINDYHASFLFEGFSCTEVEGGISVSFLAENGHSEEMMNFDIFVSTEEPGVGEVRQRSAAPELGEIEEARSGCE